MGHQHLSISQFLTPFALPRAMAAKEHGYLIVDTREDIPLAVVVVVMVITILPWVFLVAAAAWSSWRWHGTPPQEVL